MNSSKILTAAFLLSLSSIAFAGDSDVVANAVNSTGNSTNKNTNVNQNTNAIDNAIGNISSNKNTNTSSNTNTNKQGQLQGQLQGQGQAQSATNDQDVRVEGDTFEAERIPVSTAFAVAPAPSATCRSGLAGSIQLPIVGGSIGGDKAVDTCEINEAARIAATVLNNPVGATYIFCQNKWAAVMPECKAIAQSQVASVEVDKVKAEESNFKKTTFMGIGN